jgi:hypothetical protein
MRLDSGSGEATAAKLADKGSDGPVVGPMTAETGTLARYISINVLCSARLKPCQQKKKHDKIK